MEVEISADLESEIVIVAVPALSATVTSATETFGAPSLSPMVTVCVVMEPAVAFVGAPIVTTTVSDDSINESSTTLNVIEPEVCPAAIVNDPAARLWSVPLPVAVPPTV